MTLISSVSKSVRRPLSIHKRTHDKTNRRAAPAEASLPVAIRMQLKELAALIDRLQVAAGCQALHSEGHLPRLTILPFLQYHLR